MPSTVRLNTDSVRTSRLPAATDIKRLLPHKEPVTTPIEIDSCTFRVHRVDSNTFGGSGSHSRGARRSPIDDHQGLAWKNTSESYFGRLSMHA